MGALTCSRDMDQLIHIGAARSISACVSTHALWSVSKHPGYTCCVADVPQVAFGGGSVKGCQRSYGRISATSSKAEGGVGIRGEWMCGQEPYPSYSHLCMDTCSGEPVLKRRIHTPLNLHTDQTETAHVEDANKIDPSGDWADASRFPEKYAAWRQQMPQRAVGPATSASDLAYIARRTMTDSCSQELA